MAEHPEVIRKQMAETRANLTEKLEAVENLVTDSVQSTTEAVSNTVDAVKDTVENVTESVHDTVAAVKDTVTDTVQTVADTFNLKRQFDRHPWLMFGGAVAAGYLASSLFRGKSHPNGENARDTEEESRQPSSRRAASFVEGGDWSAPQQHGAPEYRPAPQPPQEAHSEPREEPREERKGWFWNELGQLKNLALGTLMGLVHDMAVRSLPGQLGQKVAEQVDHLTQNLGAEPIHGLVSEDKK